MASSQKGRNPADLRLRDRRKRCAGISRKVGDEYIKERAFDSE